MRDVLDRAPIAEQRSAQVPMTIDKAGHDDGVAGVDHLAGPGANTRGDLDDASLVDKHVALLQVGGARTEGEHAPAADQNRRAQDSACPKLLRMVS